MAIKQTNLSLLPYESTVIIKDITQKLNTIKLMKSLLESLQQALFFFKNKELHRFDAQVGETLCQIRAYQIYCLSTQPSDSLINTLVQLSTEVTEGIKTLSLQAEYYNGYLKMHKSQRPEVIRAPVTLIDFFESLHCVITIPDEALFLFISYFLYHYHLVDDEDIPMAIDFSSIANELSLSRSFAKKLGHFYQKMLSKLSCDFIFSLIKELPGADDLQAILPLLHRQSDEGRMVLPCYCVTEIIVLHMIEKNANLILLVDVLIGDQRDRIPLFLNGSKEQQDFILINDQQQRDQACIVMYGSSFSHHHSSDSILDKLHSTSIKSIILSNNASHPQYSGVTLSNYRNNHYDTLLIEQGDSLSAAELTIAKNRSSRLVQMKQLANKLGCSSTNSSLFLLKHIFCSTLGVYLKPTSGKRLLDMTNTSEEII